MLELPSASSWCGELRNVLGRALDVGVLWEPTDPGTNLTLIGCSGQEQCVERHPLIPTLELLQRTDTRPAMALGSGGSP